MKILASYKLFEQLEESKTPDQLGYDLICAVERFDMNYIHELISAGANLNYRDIDGDTALFISVLYNNLSIFKELISLGSDLSIKNNVGDNILDFIWQYANEKFRKWLKTSYAQQLLLIKEPSLIPSYIKHGYEIHPDLLKKYPHLFSGAELNFL